MNRFRCQLGLPATIFVDAGDVVTEVVLHLVSGPFTGAVVSSYSGEVSAETAYEVNRTVLREFFLLLRLLLGSEAVRATRSAGFAERSSLPSDHLARSGLHYQRTVPGPEWKGRKMWVEFFGRPTAPPSDRPGEPTAVLLGWGRFVGDRSHAGVVHTYAAVEAPDGSSWNEALQVLLGRSLAERVEAWLALQALAR